MRSARSPADPFAQTVRVVFLCDAASEGDLAAVAGAARLLRDANGGAAPARRTCTERSRTPEPLI